MFESDGWLDWDPDPERAAGEAEPTLEPYASMSKSQILDLMASAKGGREWEFLQEYFLNKCSAEELSVGTDEFMKRQYGAFDFEELCFLEGSIELALRRRVAKPGGGPGTEVRSGHNPYPFDLTGRFSPTAPAPAWDKPGNLQGPGGAGSLRTG